MAGKLQSLELEHYGPDGEPGEDQCEWPDCPAHGEHRAPRSRDEINDYRWFCTEHAREYNKRWNYFIGMTDDEVEADRRADTVWRRPSWPLGDGPPTPEHAQAFWRGDFSDPFNAFGDTAKGGHAQTDTGSMVINGDVKHALEIFGMQPPISIEDIKARYKELAKRYHPDAANGNNDEDRIKDINHAYQVIVDFLNS